jgi:SWI/SNF-related matrix-associated actin-dependent regulator 1 of chromatin subfamily A
VTVLYPYQQTGAAFLAGRQRGLLADDMGLGKTIQAIAACDEVLAVSVMVVCPASVRENWKREFEKFSWTGIEPYVVSYNSLYQGEGGDCDVLILDEAHYLKSKDSKRTKLAFGEKCDGVGGLIERAKRVILLTGTPMPNHPAELWPMLRACAPETILGKTGKPDSYWQFVSRYCKTRDNGFGLQIVGGKNLDKLKAKLEPFMLRRLKEEVMPDLPPITFSELFVEGKIDANLSQVNGHIEMIRHVLEEEGVEALARIAPHVATLRRLTGLAKLAPVVEWVKDWLDSGGGKIVIFAHHRDVIFGLFNAFNRSHEFAYLTGDVAAHKRQEAVDRFQNDPKCRIFLGQIQAAGTGITLTAASDVLFVESSWVPAENSQAAMRIHRIGQKNACLIRFATLAGSIDEQIQKAVARKTADITALFG